MGGALVRNTNMSVTQLNCFTTRWAEL